MKKTSLPTSTGEISPQFHTGDRPRRKRLKKWEFLSVVLVAPETKKIEIVKFNEMTNGLPTCRMDGVGVTQEALEEAGVSPPRLLRRSDRFRT